MNLVKCFLWEYKVCLGLSKQKCFFPTKAPFNPNSLSNIVLAIRELITIPSPIPRSHHSALFQLPSQKSINFHTQF